MHILASIKCWRKRVNDDGDNMKTNMQDTSLESYFNYVLPEIGDKQREVIRIFIDNPSMTFTNKELARELCWEINSVTPRVYELRGRDKRFQMIEPLLIESEKRQCRIGKRRSIAWQMNPYWIPGGYKID